MRSQATSYFFRQSTLPGLCIGLVFLSSLAGCRPAHELETAPVRGTVALDGKLMSGGSVIFVPERGRGATGSIAADGTYTVGTYEEADGAVVGRHKVAVFPSHNVSEFEELDVRPSKFPARYENVVSSGIEVDVKPGEENVLDLKLTTKP